QVLAVLPGASPETMASSVATPLERQFGRIAGVSEMTSTSLLGASQIVLQFDLNRSLDAAARDVQAAINAARGQLPQGKPNNPTYRKVNPADAPIMIMALTSDVLEVGRLYDAADSILAQKLSQVEGVGQVIVGGGAKPAVRVRVDPLRLSQLGIGLNDVRAALRDVNANSPKGEVADATRGWSIAASDQLIQIRRGALLRRLSQRGIGLNDVRAALRDVNASSPKGEVADATRAWSIAATDQLFDAEHYRPVIVAYAKGAPVRLGDIADIESSVEDLRTGGLANGRRGVPLRMFREPWPHIHLAVSLVA